jgi:hypothetical protein
VDIDYLNIDYAEIQNCKRRTCNGIDAITQKEKAQQMYYLGLLLYELFSGGEMPPPKLHTLAALDNSFVSLSTLTLVEKSGEEDRDLSTDSKRRQGPSKSEKDVGLCVL